MARIWHVAGDRRRDERERALGEEEMKGDVCGASSVGADADMRVPHVSGRKRKRKRARWSAGGKWASWAALAREERGGWVGLAQLHA